MSAWRGPLLVVGHRGGRGPGWPVENTLDAFERARVQGSRAVELDVRTSSDGTAVVFHDRDLARITSSRDLRRVEDVSWTELGAVDLGAGATIPALDQVLEWARSHDVAVNVELKYDVPNRMTVARAAIAAVRRSRADVLVSSFDPVLLAMATALMPTLPRAFLTHAAQPRWADVLQSVLRPPAVAAIHLEGVQATPAAVRRYRGRGLRVGAWTVNTPAEALRLADDGVASIITDQPGAVIDALGHR